MLIPLIFTVLGAFLELAGLAVLVPLLLVLLDKDGISGNEFLSGIYNYFNMESYGSFLLLLCLSILLFVVIKNFLLHLINNYRNKTLLKIYAKYSEALFTTYYKRGLLFLKGKNLTTLSQNVNSVCYSYVFNVVNPKMLMTGDIILTVLIISFLAFANIYIAIIEILLFVPFFYIYHIRVGKTLQKAGNDDNAAKKLQWRVTIETFRGYADVEINNAFEKLIGVFRKGTERISDSKIRTESIKSIASKSIETGVIAIIIGIIVGCYFIGSASADFKVLVGLFALATLKLIPSVRSAISQYSLIKTNLFTSSVIREADIENCRLQSEQCENLHFDKYIELREVQFCYQGRKKIIDTLSFTINKGETVGIKGISGSGKSTLMYLMLGLYKPDSGGIYIDGKLLTTYNRREWHKHIGYVSQDLFMMDASLAENIVLSEPFDRKRLEMVIEMSSLVDLIEKLPSGADTIIGDAGGRLSGGEKQRIAIARALYKKPSVLFLDEPTSSLDEKTEEEIADIFIKPSFRQANITVVIISHRESLLKICDRTIKLS